MPIIGKHYPSNGLDQKANIKIKLEVDSFYVKCFTLDNLFAGKMQAFLFRKWKNNVKGRDWYDLEWYIRKGVPLNLHHFLLRARDSGDWQKADISGTELRQLVDARIEAVDLNRVKADIIRFIPAPEKIALWSPNYFHDLVQQLKIEQK